MKLVIFLAVSFLVVFPTVTYNGEYKAEVKTVAEVSKPVDLPITGLDSQTSCGDGFCKLNKKKQKKVIDIIFEVIIIGFSRRPTQLLKNGRGEIPALICFPFRELQNQYSEVKALDVMTRAYYSLSLEHYCADMVVLVNRKSALFHTAIYNTYSQHNIYDSQSYSFQENYPFL